MVKDIPFLLPIFYDSGLSVFCPKAYQSTLRVSVITKAIRMKRRAEPATSA